MKRLFVCLVTLVLFAAPVAAADFTMSTGIGYGSMFSANLSNACGVNISIHDGRRISDYGSIYDIKTWLDIDLAYGYQIGQFTLMAGSSFWGNDIATYELDADGKWVLNPVASQMNDWKPMVGVSAKQPIGPVSVHASVIYIPYWQSLEGAVSASYIFDTSRWAVPSHLGLTVGYEARRDRQGVFCGVVLGY